MSPLSVVLLLVGCSESSPCPVEGEDSLGTLTEWELEHRAQPGPELPEVQSLTLAEDGLPLAYREFVPEGWDGSGVALVFVPGSSAHSGLYGDLGVGLAERGVLVRILDVRGHGLSVCAESGCGAPESVDRDPVDDGAYWTGRVGDSLDEQQIVRDVGHLLADMAEANPEATLALGGHSSGGGVVSRLVESTGAPGVHRFLLLAPYNHPEQPQVRPEVLLDCPETGGTHYARLDLGALGDALRGNVHRFVLHLHKSEQYTDPLDTLAYSYTTMTGMAASSPQGFWPAYGAPVLLLTGSDDHLLDPEISETQVALAAQGSFGELPETSHIGIIWSPEAVDQAAEFLLAD
ncbi:MAG: alpha/beta hydrolase [Myxococcota bacterium]|nr:alpha/beta hydrolase [Myxococcota bacterium]